MAAHTQMMQTVEQLGILRAEQHAQAAGIEELFPEPEAFAHELVHRGWLTAFQAAKLLAGKHHELVLGSYLLLDELGQGGMGQVFKARHRIMRRVVALKIMRPLCLQGPESVRRFHREVQALSRLTHANVVLAHDAGQEGDRHFFVMEYVDGIDLARWVQRHGPMPISLACNCIRQAALGLQHAHEHGLIHRDIKPANLLLAGPAAAPESTAPEKSVVKVLDLGLARWLTPQDGLDSLATTEQGMIMGTPDFIAPEQIDNVHTADIRADIYSLGCTFYFLLTGKAPFAGNALMTKLVKHREIDPIPVDVLRPDIPPALVAILRTMLAKNPALRYQTPADAAVALEPFCSERTAPNKPACFRIEELFAHTSDDIEETISGNPESSIAAEEFHPRRSGLLTRRRILAAAGVVACLCVLIIWNAISEPGEGKGSDDVVVNQRVQTKNRFGSEPEAKLDDNAKPNLVKPAAIRLAAAEFADASIVPLKEWLKGRDILTVSQDGKGKFRTIQAALDASKSGQVVQVLDRGPYNENVFFSKPPNSIALVSEVNTQIDIPEWIEAPLGAGPPARAWWIHAHDLRLSGFTIRCPKILSPYTSATAIRLGISGDGTIDSCRVLRDPEESRWPVLQDTPQVPPLGALTIFGPNNTTIRVEDNNFEGYISVTCLAKKLAFRRNRIRCWSYSGLTVSTEPQYLLVSHNLMQSAYYGIVCTSRDTPMIQSLLIHNNDLDTVMGPIFFEAHKVPSRARIENNVFRARQKKGIVFPTPEFKDQATNSWKVGHNCYAQEIKDNPRFLYNFPKQLSDLRFSPGNLTENGADLIYRRLPADGPLASAGVGGDLPRYIGPVPPGPVPKGDDWLSRLESLR